MSKIALTPNASGTGVFTISSPATSTDRTLTLPDEAGTVLTSASSITQNAGPAFSAWQSSGQSVSSGVWTKILYQTELFDTNSNFDSSRFTPTVAGYYQISAAASFGGAASVHTTGMYVNGVEFKRGGDGSTTQASMSVLLYLNGSTDFVEFYVHSTTSANTDTVSSRTWFTGALVRAA